MILLKLNRRDKPERGMPALTVIKHLNPSSDLTPSLITSSPPPPVIKLIL